MPLNRAHHIQDVALRFDGTGQLHTAGHVAQRERQEGFRQALYITFIQGCRNLRKEIELKLRTHWQQAVPTHLLGKSHVVITHKCFTVFEDKYAQLLTG